MSVAASVDFNARLDDAIKTNILGILDLIEIAHQTKNLQSFTHISTCYVNTNQPQGLIQQKIYQNSTDPQEQLSHLMNMPIQQLIKQTPNLIKGFPNSYTFTKNLCERIIQKRRKNISLSILRPSIISASYKQPAMGWLDAVTAIGAIYLTSALGILYHLHCIPTKCGDLIPVDIVADYAIILNAANSKTGKFELHHCGSSHRNPITWGEVLTDSRAYFTQVHLEHRVMQYGVQLIRSQKITKLKQTLRRTKYQMFQKVAGYLGSNKVKKDYSRLLKQITRAQNINQVFQFFMTSQWIFQQHNIHQLQSLLTAQELSKFNINVANIDMDLWVLYSCYGIQKYILKQKVGQPPLKQAIVLSTKPYFSDLRWALRQGPFLGYKNKIYYTQTVLNSNNVNCAVSQYALNKISNHKKKVNAMNQAHKLARQAATSILADWKNTSVKTFAWTLHKIFRKMFSGIQLKAQQLARLQNIEGPVILLPNHRSYIDYVLIPYLFYANGLKLPHVSSDSSISNIFIFSNLFKQTGAFSYDRARCKRDPLYNSVLQQYIKSLLSNDQILLSFLQGTRSRTGKILQPTFQLLQFVAQGIRQRRYTDATIVPITISYQKVVQGDTFPLELLGEQKVQQSFLRIVKSIKLLKQDYGRIYVDFLQPFSICDFLSKQDSSQALGMHVLRIMNANIAIMPVSIVSALMLQNRKGISQEQLAKRFQWLYRLINQRGFKVGGVNQMSPRSTVQSVIRLLSNILSKSKHNVFQLSLQPGRQYQNILLLSYYRNMLMHIFVNQALVCLCLCSEGLQLCKGKGIKNAIVLQNFLFTKNLFKRQIIQLMPIQFQQIIKIMEQRAILQEGQQQDTKKVTRLGEDAFMFMCSLMWPITQCYWATLQYLTELLQKGSVQMKVSAFVNQVQWFAQCMHDDRAMQYYQSCSAQTISNAVKALADCKILSIRKESIIDSCKLSEIYTVQNQVRKFLRNGFARNDVSKL